MSGVGGMISGTGEGGQIRSAKFSDDATGVGAVARGGAGGRTASGVVTGVQAIRTA